MGNGAGQGEQDGQLLAMGHSWSQLSGNGRQTVPECGAVGKGQQVAG